MTQKTILPVVIIVMALTSWAWAAESEWEIKNESELGLVASQGNSNSETVNLKQLTSFRRRANLIRAQYHFLRTESSHQESARRWDGQLRFERELSKRFGAFVAQGYESDPYAGFNTRANSEIGGRYTILKDETWDWFTELGYRYSVEKRVADRDVFAHYGRLYSEVNTQWTSTFSTEMWMEYLPNFSQHQEYRVNGEISASVMLTRVLSLKTAFLVRYNNDPPPKILQTTDKLLTSSIVAKF